MASDGETAAMRRAIELAALGRPTTLPNPVVGCVILGPDGAAVGEGWHHHPGGPHAEVDALTEAGPRARNGTAVVTLEPCNHTGRTGPCSQALIQAGVSRVVIAVPDPSPSAAGGGRTLREAGVDVENGLLEHEATEVNRPWLVATRRRRPFVTWKFAATLDGRSAAADGSSRWITGPEARNDVHRLRSEVDAMLVGVGTVLADDPALTARTQDGRLRERQPLRVVADTYGRTPATARVCNDEAATWIATADDAGGAGLDPHGHLDLRNLLSQLYERHDRRHVLLEGGPTLAGAMIEQGLVDQVVAYLAPALLGAGPPALGPAGITSIGGAWRLDPLDVRTFGPDVRLVARPVAGPATD